MSEDDSVAVTVTILDKEYHVACPPGQQDALLASARHLDERMRAIRGTGKVVGVDRIAVMAALNIVHDLLSKESEEQGRTEYVRSRIRALEDRIDVALEKTPQVEL